VKDGTPVRLIAERYQPLEVVRPGAPQRARDLETAQTVILRDVALDPAIAEAALGHARAAKRIFHPSLVTLFDIYTQGLERVLLAYEYVPAQTVAQVTGGQPLNPRRAAEILVEIADAVATLHAHGATHGGISPLSVLVTMKGKAKLDRVGDPTLTTTGAWSAQGDVAALSELLQVLVGKPGPGVAGMQAIETVIARARDGTLEAATFAAMLRKL
jgi:serine/threonine protein kinase